LSVEFESILWLVIVAIPACGRLLSLLSLFKWISAND